MVKAKPILIMAALFVAASLSAKAETYSINFVPPPALVAKGRAMKPLVLRLPDPDAFCRAGGGRSGGHIAGCSGFWKATGTPIIVVPFRASATRLKRILDHEYAHVGGWEH